MAAMKLSLSTTINLPPEEVWRRVQTPELLMHIAAPLVRFRPIEPKSVQHFREGERYLVALRLFGFLPFGNQWIVPSLHVEEQPEWPKKLRDNGHSALIKTWDHWITVEPDGAGGTRYRDELKVEAGALTPVVWLFAQVFYRHRQRRWRALAERASHAVARAKGDQHEAWRHLERAHILGQLRLGLHIHSHLRMLGYAVQLRQPKEIAGQLMRLALAPLGNLTGRLPWGNNGRSNVSAFVEMEVPDDLKAIIAAARQSD
jgi:ligand-binding SRPBCC domain-containing protein